MISQVVPGLGQHHHHHMMVDSDSHQDDASGTVPQPSQTRSASSSTTRRHSGSGASSADSNSPHIRHRSSREQSSTPPSRPATQEPGSGQPITTVPRHYHDHVNQRSRGFDQSGFPLSNDPRVVLSASPPSPRLHPTYRSSRSLGGSEATSPSRIKVRDLSHIRSFASEEYLARPRLGHRTGGHFSEPGIQYEISSMPVTDIIEMVAGLLTKITTTNDRQHEHHRPVPLTEEQSHLNPNASCVLAFHGKNVPSIGILSYLSRIHKYCPTTYEVFLSLLVYFDRMTEVVNRGLLETLQEERAESPSGATDSRTPTPRSPVPMNLDGPPEPPDASIPSASGSMAPSDHRAAHAPMPPPPVSGVAGDLSQFFVVDSYNIHRLVIAGVTCASKFFSDVFYTNSRYAKVRTNPDIHLIIDSHFLGGRSSVSGAQQSGTPVSPPQRL